MLIKRKNIINRILRVIVITFLLFLLESFISFQFITCSIISDTCAKEKYNIEDFDYIFDSEIEDTVNTIQPIPEKYNWLFPTDKKSDIAWKKYSKHFLLPIDFRICYLPDKGRFRCNRVLTDIPHTGIDLYAHDKADVLATMAGKVIYVGDIGAKGRGKAFGWTIIIEHTDHEGTRNNYYSLYAHINKKSICVNLNDEVAQGQIIAKVGNTGNARGYPTQVHFEIRKTLDPILAKIRIGSRSSYKKVQLFNPEIIYKREELYTHIRNVDSKSMLSIIEKNLPAEFINDQNLMDYISQVGLRLSNTVYPVNPVKTILAANVDLNYGVGDSLVNEFLSRIISIHTNSLKHYSIAVNNSDSSIIKGSDYFRKMHDFISKSKYRKFLNIAFRLTSNKGVKLYYKKSDNNTYSHSYQNGIIVNNNEYSYILSDLLRYQKLAVLEFGCPENFYDLDDQGYTRLVIQSQNLIEYLARDKDDIAMFAYNDKIMEFDDSLIIINHENSPVFFFPDYFIVKLFQRQKPAIHIGTIKLKDIVNDNKDILQQLYDRFKDKSAELIRIYDEKLREKAYTFEYLDSMTTILDSFVNLGVIKPKKARRRYDIINKYGLTISYKANDEIWDALQEDRIEVAMNLFIKNSKYLLHYSEEQYDQIFKRIENYKNIEQQKNKGQFDFSSDEDESNEDSEYDFISTSSDVDKSENIGNHYSRGKSDTDDNNPKNTSKNKKSLVPVVPGPVGSK